MGKFVEIADRNKKQWNLIKKEVMLLVKTFDCNKEELEFQECCGVYTVFLSNDGKVGRDIANLISKNEYAKEVVSVDGPGLYDWNADTYIRPYSSVSFTF